MAQTVKNLPAMQQTQVQFLGREDPLEKDMAIHSSILAWRIPWTEETGRLQSKGGKASDMTEATKHEACTGTNSEMWNLFACNPNKLYTNFCDKSEL